MEIEQFDRRLNELEDTLVPRRGTPYVAERHGEWIRFGREQLCRLRERRAVTVDPADNRDMELKDDGILVCRGEVIDCISKLSSRCHPLFGSEPERVLDGVSVILCLQSATDRSVLSRHCDHQH